MKVVGFQSTSEGLEGQMSAHFGHVSAFTLVQYDETTNTIIDVKSIQESNFLNFDPRITLRPEKKLAMLRNI